MLRKGSSWLGGLALAGLVLGGCAAGTETEEETPVASEEAVEQEEVAGREAAVTAQDHVIYMEATEDSPGKWSCTVDPDPVWITSGDTVTFSGERLPQAVAKVVVRTAPTTPAKPASTTKPANPPYDVPEGGRTQAGSIRGSQGDFWIYVADFHLRKPTEPPAGKPDCVVDPVVCIGDPPPQAPEDENGESDSEADPDLVTQDDPCA